MKKTLKSIAMLAAAFVALAAVSCTKEETPAAEQENGISTITISIEQPTAEDATKTALGEKSGEYYPINWSAGDSIAVSAQSGSTFAKYTLSTGSGSTTGTFTTTETAPSGAVYAYYPYANVTGVSTRTYTVTIPDEQQYVAGSFGNGAMPMYAKADAAGSLQSMKPLMSVLKISLTGSCKVHSILLQSASVALSGSAVADMDAGVLTINPTTGKKYVLLSCGEGVQLSSEATTFHIVVPATDAAVTDFTVTIKDDKGYTMKKSLSTSSKFTAKVIKNVGSALPVTTSCLLPGKFSVASGKMVQFTTANLWCNASASPATYNFESAQNVTYATLGQSAYTASHVCHFFWTKTAANSYAASFNDGELSTEDIPYFAESKGGLTVDGQSGLYALTSGEWNYIFNSRTNASTLYKTGVSVTTSAGTVANCVVIAPDVCLGGYTFDNTKTSYTAAEWATAEAGGIVCLPAAGYRSGSTCGYAGSYGTCWSSTPEEDLEDSAFGIYFNDSKVCSYDFSRYDGRSVRLVSSVSE